MTDDQIELAAWLEVGTALPHDKITSKMVDPHRQIFIRGARVARRAMLGERAEMLAGLRLAVWLLNDMSPEGGVRKQLVELIAKVEGNSYA